MALNDTSGDAYQTLMTRRSTVARTMAAPGPDQDTLQKILAAGLRVPDHGKLAPWRFIVLQGADRERLGALISQALKAEDGVSDKIAEKMQGYATQGPTLVVAVSSPMPDHPVIPLWEQHLSVGAACMTMLHAATALGVASQWLTGWAAYSKTVARGLGLSEDERIAGLLFFGSAPEREKDRPRPDPADKIHWGFPDMSAGSGK